MVWSFFAEPPLAAAVVALVAIGLGAVCFTVGTVLKARAERVSPLRLIGRVLWAPIKFVLENTF